MSTREAGESELSIREGSNGSTFLHRADSVVQRWTRSDKGYDVGMSKRSIRTLRVSSRLRSVYEHRERLPEKNSERKREHA